MIQYLRNESFPALSFRYGLEVDDPAVHRYWVTVNLDAGSVSLKPRGAGKMIKDDFDLGAIVVWVIQGCLASTAQRQSNRYNEARSRASASCSQASTSDFVWMCRSAERTA